MPTDGAVQVVALINDILNKTPGGRQSMRTETVMSMLPPTVAA